MTIIYISTSQGDQSIDAQNLVPHATEPRTLTDPITYGSITVGTQIKYHRTDTDDDTQRKGHVFSSQALTQWWNTDSSKINKGPSCGTTSGNKLFVNSVVREINC